MSSTASVQAGLQVSVQRDKGACQDSEHCEADRMTPEYLTEQGMLHWSHQQGDVSDEWAAVALQITHPWCKTTACSAPAVSSPKK